MPLFVLLLKHAVASSLTFPNSNMMGKPAKVFDFSSNMHATSTSLRVLNENHFAERKKFSSAMSPSKVICLY